MSRPPRQVLVVGAGSDIGRAICAVLLARGDRVTATWHRREPPELPGQRLLACDLSLPDGVTALMDAAGELDDLVWVAGHHRLAPVGPRGSGHWPAHARLNVEAALEACGRLAARRDATGPRSITLVASIAHRLGEAGLAAYSASKAALVSATRCLAVEYAGRGIRVNSVSPGWIEGDTAARMRERLELAAVDALLARYPLGAGTPADVAHAVDFLSDPVRARWITGIDLVVDGGRTCR